MELDAYLEKIYVIKSLTIPQGFNIQYHYAKWISPRVSELRFDRFMDIPFANVTFVDAYAKGDFQNGERYIDIGAAGFPSLLRAPFTALSANEFRFPSKNIDQNIRHVVMEILKNSRFLAMGEDMFRFLSGRQILCLENSTVVQAHVASLFAVVRDKVPLKCNSCKKFLWIELVKLPENPVQAKCPACSHTFSIQRPAGLDMGLNRFASPAAVAGAVRQGDLLLGSTGEFRSQEFPQMPLAGPAPEPAAGLNLELDLDSILGPAPTSKPAQAEPAVADGPLSSVEPGTEDEYMPPPTAAAPSAGDEYVPPPTPAAGPSVELDDDFFQEILPDKAALPEKPAAPPPVAAPRTSSPAEGGLHPSLIMTDPASQERETKRCHVCQTPLSGGEKVCPSCFAEVLPDEVMPDQLSLPTEGQIEIRLKDDPTEEHMPAYEPTPEAASPSPDAAKSKDDADTWDQPIWSVKIGEETYENLGMRTIEEWILSQSVIESDLVRKGDTKWTEIGSVPYFRTAFKQVKEQVQFGSEHALTSFQPAPTVKRVIAGVIDAVVCVLLAFLGIFVYNLTAGVAEGGLSLAALLTSVAVPVIYLSFGNGVMGRTFGKGLMKLAVINSLGKPIGLSKGLLRTLIVLLTGGLGFLIALSNPKSQALYDKLVDCYVIQME